MPSTIIHEEVGFYLSKKLNINSYDYYLGLLAPDAPNLESFASKEERWTAHQRDKDYEKWYNNAKKFYKNNKDNFNKDFLIGYYIHIITDIAYDNILYKQVREEIEKENMNEDGHTIMTKDMNNYYFKEIELIKDILSKSNKSYDILNISKDKLNKFKIKCLNNFTNKNTSVFITKDVIDKLNEKVFNAISKILLEK